MKPAGAVSLRALDVREISKAEAVAFIRLHHSALPSVQTGPWQVAFGAFWQGTLVAAALWHNPSARGLPAGWGELRRMAVSVAAPPNTASAMLGRMAQMLRGRYPRLVSYQDLWAHTGTIYRAAGWTPTFVSRARQRDRTPPRRGADRPYRTDANGATRAAAPKLRWEKSLTGELLRPIDSTAIARAAAQKVTK